MRPWLLLWRVEALLLAVLVGCSGTPQAVRVETRVGGETLLHIPRTETAEPVTVPPREVKEALQRMAREVRLTGTPRETVDRLLELDPQYGNYLYLMGERKLVPQGAGMPLEGALTEDEQQLATRYKAWCRSAQGYAGDCLGGALVEGKYLDTRGRYMWAMALSKSPVLEEFERALGEMVSMQAVMQAAMGVIVTLLMLLAMPEPVTKAIAAWGTAALIVWVGALTLYNLITGWFELMKETREATTFEQIREAVERFGKLFSREAAQAFATMAAVLARVPARVGDVRRARPRLKLSELAGKLPRGNWPSLGRHRPLFDEWTWNELPTLQRTPPSRCRCRCRSWVRHFSRGGQD
jgi:hypothetical protein